MTRVKQHRQYVFLFKILMSIVFCTICILFIYFTFSSAKQTPNKQAPSSLPEQVDEFKDTSFSLVINNAIFTGQDKGSIPYKITSDKASKIKGGLYWLDKVDAFYTPKNESSKHKTRPILKIKSLGALLNTDNNLLKLQDDIMLDYNELKLYCSEIEINLNDQSAKSNKAVKGEYHNSHIESDTLNSAPEGNEVTFDGNVFTCINLDDTNIQ